MLIIILFSGKSLQKRRTCILLVIRMPVLITVSIRISGKERWTAYAAHKKVKTLKEW